MTKEYSFDTVINMIISDADYYEFIDLDREKVIDELHNWISEYKDTDDFDWVFYSEDLIDIRQYFENQGYQKFI